MVLSILAVVHTRIFPSRGLPKRTATDNETGREQGLQRFAHGAWQGKGCRIHVVQDQECREECPKLGSVLA